MQNNVICEVGDMYLSYHRKQFYTEKNEKQFVNFVKKSIRGSLEYKEWKKLLIQEMQLTKCLFTGEDVSEVSIEFHHHPISLENIVYAVVDKYIRNEIEFNTCIIMDEVLKKHYEMKIGIVPMVKTLHEKFHNGYLNIPISFVIGDYKKFIEEYPLRDKAMEIVNKYENITKTNHIGWNKYSINEGIEVNK